MGLLLIIMGIILLRLGLRTIVNDELQRQEKRLEKNQG